MPANLKEVRERITSVNNTQQITKAMKMVSAAKLRRAQQAITQMRPYSQRLNRMMANILANVDTSELSISYGVERPVVNVLVVVITSNRGLCGAFNSNVIKSAEATVREKYQHAMNSGNLTFLCIGKKGYEYFYKRYSESCTILNSHVNLFDDLSFDNISKVSDIMMEGFSNGTYDAITVSYGKFKNAATQFAHTEQFLPVPKIEASVEEGSGGKKADYIFEPSKAELLNHLIPSILQTQFQSYNLDTHASEHGARMTAMDKATENADELLKELKINYNKARQAAITKQISEIVGGAAAMES